jgi:hypothetical protein
VLVLVLALSLAIGMVRSDRGAEAAAAGNGTAALATGNGSHAVLASSQPSPAEIYVLPGDKVALHRWENNTTVAVYDFYPYYLDRPHDGGLTRKLFLSFTLSQSKEGEYPDHVLVTVKREGQEIFRERVNMRWFDEEGTGSGQAYTNDGIFVERRFINASEMSPAGHPKEDDRKTPVNFTVEVTDEYGRRICSAEYADSIEAFDFRRSANLQVGDLSLRPGSGKGKLSLVFKLENRGPAFHGKADAIFFVYGLEKDPLSARVKHFKFHGTLAPGETRELALGEVPESADFHWTLGYRQS